MDLDFPPTRRSGETDFARVDRVIGFLACAIQSEHDRQITEHSTLTELALGNPLDVIHNTL